MNLTTQAIVLRAVNYKESDKILTLLTRDSGKLTVTARACRKSRKQGGGVSAAAQLLVWSDVVLKEYRGRWTLSEAVTNREFRGVREDLDKMALGSYFAEVTELLAPEGVPAPELLALLLNSLYALESLDRPLPLVKAAFELRAMCLAGYAPALDRCALCGAEQPEEPRFHLREGVLHCRGCRVGDGISLPLDAGSLTAMRHIVSCPSKRLFSFRLSGPGEKRLGDAAEGFLLTQLERGFYTLDFYKQIKTN
ncbi:MAG: DNA repair protein RecO [Clostridiales bacterium]|nr:DNA repair protein RecO [Clostridiales bacterium]